MLNMGFFCRVNRWIYLIQSIISMVCFVLFCFVKMKILNLALCLINRIVRFGSRSRLMFCFVTNQYLWLKSNEKWQRTERNRNERRKTVKRDYLLTTFTTIMRMNLTATVRFNITKQNNHTAKNTHTHTHKYGLSSSFVWLRTHENTERVWRAFRTTCAIIRIVIIIIESM